MQANRPKTILQLHIQLTELITLFPIITRYEKMAHQSIKTAPFRIALLKFYFTSLSMMLFSPSCTEAYEQYMRLQLKALGTKVMRSISYFGPSFVEIEDATDALAQAALPGMQQRQAIVKAEENCIYCGTNNKTSIIVCSCDRAFIHTVCYDQALRENINKKVCCPNLNCGADFAFDWCAKRQGN